jgi:hypothetical protein
MDVAMFRKYKKSERRIFMSNKTRLTKDSRRMDKLLRETVTKSFGNAADILFMKRMESRTRQPSAITNR